MDIILYQVLNVLYRILTILVKTSLFLTNYIYFHIYVLEIVLIDLLL